MGPSRVKHDSPSLSRRALLRAGALSLLALAVGPADALARARRGRRLRMLHTHTGERLDVVYAEGDALVPGALAEVDRFLRDHRTGDVHPIDPGVLDISWALAQAAGRPAGEFEIISGFRSEHTNDALRDRGGAGTGVARRSLHLVGKAVDLRLPGVSTRRLRDLALRLERGGVGFYRDLDFVHVDTGRPRTWGG
jgi:uncharacterized protein YcbK (DUF882 family)